MASWADLARFLRPRLHVDEAATRATMTDLATIRHEKLWFLVASAVIASVGLNTDSAAVVIGAMLVSPLMGPIVGLGYALAVRDRDFAKRAGRYLAVSIGVSLFVSAAFFALSPLKEPTAEILARTRPNLLDLLVALAAALAGSVALASTEVSATLPGVAIATAIIPPLCTSGYGLASGEWRLALGAFYLFTVNAVAIALCAYLLFGRLHFAKLAVGSAGRMPRWTAAAITAAFLAPLGFSLWETAREAGQRRAVRRFADEISATHRLTTWSFEPGVRPRLTLFLFDHPTPEQRQALAARFATALPGARLALETADLSPQVKETLEKLKSSVADSSLALREVQRSIEEARQREPAQREERRAAAAETTAVVSEWKLLEPRLGAAELLERPDGPLLAVVSPARPLSPRDEAAFARRWAPWLALRTKREVEIAFVRGRAGAR